jgi:hypothetical protein
MCSSARYRWTKPFAHQIALDRLHGSDHARIISRQKADKRHHQNPRIELV